MLNLEDVFKLIDNGLADGPGFQVDPQRDQGLGGQLCHAVVANQIREIASQMFPDIAVVYFLKRCVKASSFHPDDITNSKLTIHCAEAVDMPLPDRLFDMTV